VEGVKVMGSDDEMRILKRQLDTMLQKNALLEIFINDVANNEMNREEIRTQARELMDILQSIVEDV
jgi:hypothetical protein